MAKQAGGRGGQGGAAGGVPPRGFSKELIWLESVEGENPNLVSYDFWRPGAAETPCRAFLARTMFIAAPDDGVRKTRHENNQSCLPPLAAPPRSRRESLLDLAR